MEQEFRYSHAPDEPSLAASVAILMCTLQGEAFLAEQLDSIAAQTHTNWSVWVSDDGSTDGTLAVLAAYRSRWGTDRLSVIAGPSTGSCTNFLSLTSCPDIQADFYAWADQDDVWETDKLARAVACLRPLDDRRPLLYGARTLLTDAGNQPVGLSPPWPRSPSFANALVQNFAGGNTMVFNQAARALIAQAGPQVSAVAHDWWAYLLIAGCGGTVLYDAHPAVRYRQHGRNQIGSTPHPLTRIRRLQQLLGGQFSRWIDANLASLDGMRPHITPANLVTLDRFASSRHQALPQRLSGLCESGVHRQTLLGNVMLACAALVGRI